MDRLKAGTDGVFEDEAIETEELTDDAMVEDFEVADETTASETEPVVAELEEDALDDVVITSSSSLS